MNPSATPKTRRLDVRAMIAAGEQPFSRIADALGALEARETLVVITPFLPSPLIEKAQSEGFAAQPERRSDGAWQTRLTRK